MQSLRSIRRTEKHFYRIVLASQTKVKSEGDPDVVQPTQSSSVCRSGARAMTAAQILTRAGFQRVSVLAGGMIASNKTA
jgi:rhodanese-related sulfurtransferase